MLAALFAPGSPVTEWASRRDADWWCSPCDASRGPSTLTATAVRIRLWRPNIVVQLPVEWCHRLPGHLATSPDLESVEEVYWRALDGRAGAVRWSPERAGLEFAAGRLMEFPAPNTRVTTDVRFGCRREARIQ